MRKLYLINFLLIIFSSLLIFNCDKEEPVAPTTEFQYAYSNSVNEIRSFKGSIWVGTSIGLFRSDDGGNNWISFRETSGIAKGGISALYIKNNVIWVASAYDSLIDGATFAVGAGLSYSTDYGGTWRHIPQPLPQSDWTLINTITYDIEIIGNTIWIASFGGGLMKSSDMGESWTVRPPDNKNFDPDENMNHRVFSLLAVGDTLWVGTAEGINISYDAGETWVSQFTRQNQDQPISGNFVVALHKQQLGTQQNIWAATVETDNPYEERGASKTSNSGTSWETYLEGVFVNNFESSDSTFWAASDYGVLFTDDGGASWNQYVNIVDSTKKLVIATQDYFTVCFESDTTSLSQGLWFGCSQGLAHSSDNGNHWSISEFLTSTNSNFILKNRELSIKNNSYHYKSKN